MDIERYPNGMSKHLVLADLQEQSDNAKSVLQALLGHRDVFVSGFLTAGQLAKKISAFHAEELESEEVADSALQLVISEARKEITKLEAQMRELRAQIGTEP